MQVGPPIRRSRDRLETRRPAAPPVSTSSSDRMQELQNRTRMVCAQRARCGRAREGHLKGSASNEKELGDMEGEEHLGRKEDLAEDSEIGGGSAVIVRRRRQGNTIVWRGDKSKVGIAALALQHTYNNSQNMF
ncbi:hypothetical protein NUW54_g12611 [Trametes sanguinea]|uniref:Uncharacterized protein n=1 Tax=Trametes sanguinea TaxID=158606 RepID=A0ACC1MXP3_9APHY|nr:hypothetical protein NUW54_g12611 [Trametes sanguinea]